MEYKRASQINFQKLIYLKKKPADYKLYETIHHQYIHVIV